MSSTQETRSPARRRRRAARACGFCRQRKLRCDNELPVCANCKTYAHECIYSDTPAPARPTKARLAELQNENRRLRGRLSASAELSPQGADGDVQDEQRSARRSSQLRYSTVGSTPEFPSEDCSSALAREVGQPQSAVSRIFVSADGDSSYHGVTSTLFDDASTDKPSVQVLADPKMPVEWVKKGLMAEAARQQQLETMNFNQGNLDFDGVDPDLGLHLLSLHWNRQHFSFLTTYRPAFMRDMASGGPYFSKLLLNAIYFGASKFSPRLEVRRDADDVRTAGWVYRRRVKELLGDALDRSEITTIQALLVMSSSLFALGDERSAAWLYAGIAFRMITDLGIHVDATMLPNMRRLSDEDLEIRRRVFWAAFVVDKIQSLYQGRPVSLQHLESQVPLTFLDQFEEMEYWKPFAYTNNKAYAGSPAYGVSTFTELCKLSIILNEILNKVYSERSATAAPEEVIEKLNYLHSELVAWYSALPPHLKFEPDRSPSVPPPHVLSLLAMYNVLLILLHRPFVADGHLQSTNLSIAIDSFSICAAAASQITSLIRVYEQTFSIGRAPYLISYATYVAATILVRIAAQRDGESEAHSGLRLCLSVFRENQETNWAVRWAKSVIQHLMERMGMSLDLTRPRTERGMDSQRSLAKGISGANDAAAAGSSAANAQAAAATNGKETEDLNINMIIQSFLRDQNNNPRPNHGPVGAWFSHGQYQAAVGVGSSYDADLGAAPSTAAAQIPPPENDAAAPLPLRDPALATAADDPPWEVGSGSFDDMLFGFNSAFLDGMTWSSGFTPTG